MKSLEPRLIFGLVLILILGFLAALFGLGHVEEKTSFGLMPIVQALGMIGALWAQGYFQPKNTDKDDKDKP